MNILFMRRNFIFVLFTFVLMIFSCSAADAAYTGQVDEVISDNECLTFSANQDGSSVIFNYSSGSVQYKKNGSTWQDYNKGDVISLNKDEYVKFRGTGVTTDSVNSFSMTGSISASGYVDSLRLKSLDPNSGDYRKFQDLTNRCYNYMFKGCTSLISAPELPATNLATGCYLYMFSGCTSLTSAPGLPVQTLAVGCYRGMFKGCTSLTNVPELPATSLAMNCYYAMFKGCTSLTNAPELPATTLAERCYESMFDGCSSLDLSTTPGGDYVYSWTFKKGDTDMMLPNGIWSSAPVIDGYVTVYSKYPLSAPRYLIEERDMLVSDTIFVNSGRFSKTELKLSDGSGSYSSINNPKENEKAYLVIKSEDGEVVATSAIFDLLAEDGKIMIPAQDLHLSNSIEVADESSELWIEGKPGIYQVQLRIFG